MYDAMCHLLFITFEIGCAISRVGVLLDIVLLFPEVNATIGMTSMVFRTYMVFFYNEMPQVHSVKQQGHC